MPWATMRPWEPQLETRLLIAYTIIAVMVVGGTVGFVAWRRRRNARRLRLRGIKVDQR